MPFYPDDAPIPAELRTDELLLRPLLTSDAALDYAAVMASRDLLHLRSGGSWPRDGFTLDENRADLEAHERDFRHRAGFTYTVMKPGETECLGCVYIYPLSRILARAGSPSVEGINLDAAEASFWVRPTGVARDLDRRLLAVLLPWLRRDFAFSELYLRCFAAETRHAAIFADAGLHLVHALPAGDTRLLLFA
jgi:RimJ/RimL family protein N-acetyltransferase